MAMVMTTAGTGLWEEWAGAWDSGESGARVVREEAPRYGGREGRALSREEESGGKQEGVPAWLERLWKVVGVEVPASRRASWAEAVDQFLNFCRGKAEVGALEKLKQAYLDDVRAKKPAGWLRECSEALRAFVAGVENWRWEVVGDGGGAVPRFRVKRSVPAAEARKPAADAGAAMGPAASGGAEAAKRRDPQDGPAAWVWRLQKGIGVSMTPVQAYWWEVEVRRFLRFCRGSAERREAAAMVTRYLEKLKQDGVVDWKMKMTRRALEEFQMGTESWRWEERHGVWEPIFRVRQGREGGTGQAGASEADAESIF